MVVCYVGRDNNVQRRAGMQMAMSYTEGINVSSVVPLPLWRMTPNRIRRPQLVKEDRSVRHWEGQIKI